MNEITSCDIFTPDKISKIMASYLNNKGTLLEPSVGTGDLLRNVNISNYSKIDVYDIKKEYIDKILCTFNKFNTDFLKVYKTIGKYDNIILNPPYIRYQDLPLDYRVFIQNTFPLLSGNFDIYYAFILACIEILSDEGVMVAIIPNALLTSKSSKPLLDYLMKNRFIMEIIDYGSEKVFSGVSVYICIIVLNKKPKDTYLYNTFQRKYVDNIGKDVKRLGDYFEIKNGLATLRDKIFVHDTKLYDEPCWQPIHYSTHDRMCIYPYSSDGKIIQEDEFKNLNPNTYNYLVSQKDELKERDKCKKTYETWYAYGRTQAIKISKDEQIMFLSTFIDPNNLNFLKRKPQLYAGCFCVLIRGDKTLDDFEKFIRNNIEKIREKSNVRGGGWITLSTVTLKGLEWN